MYYLACCPKGSTIPRIDPDHLEQLAKSLQDQKDARNGVTNTSRPKQLPRPPSSSSRTTTTATSSRPNSNNIHKTTNSPRRKNQNKKVEDTTKQLSPKQEAQAVRIAALATSGSFSKKRKSSQNFASGVGSAVSSTLQATIRGGRSSSSHHIIEEDGKARPASATTWMSRTIHAGHAAISAGKMPRGNFTSASGSIRSNGFTCGLCYGKYGAPLVAQDVHDQQVAMDALRSSSSNSVGGGGHSAGNGGGGEIDNGSSAGRRRKSLLSSTTTATGSPSSGGNANGGGGGSNLINNNHNYNGEDQDFALQTLDHVATPAALVSMRAVIAVRRRFARRAKQMSANNNNNAAAAAAINSYSPNNNSNMNSLNSPTSMNSNNNAMLLGNSIAAACNDDFLGLSDDDYDDDDKKFHKRNKRTTSKSTRKNKSFDSDEDLDDDDENDIGNSYYPGKIGGKKKRQRFANSIQRRQGLGLFESGGNDRNKNNNSDGNSSGNNKNRRNRMRSPTFQANDEPPSLAMNGAPLYSGTSNRTRRQDMESAKSAVHFGYETVAVCRFCSQFFGVFMGQRFDEDEEKRKDVARAKKLLQDQKKLRETQPPDGTFLSAGIGIGGGKHPPSSSAANSPSAARMQHQPFGSFSKKDSHETETEEQQNIRRQQQQQQMLLDIENFAPGYVDEDVEREKRDDKIRRKNLREKQRKDREKTLAILYETNNVLKEKNQKYDQVSKRVDDVFDAEAVIAEREKKLQQQQQQQQQQNTKASFVTPQTSNINIAQQQHIVNSNTTTPLKLLLEKKVEEAGYDIEEKIARAERQRIDAEKAEISKTREEMRQHRQRIVEVGTNTKERATAHFMSLKRQAENNAYAFTETRRRMQHDQEMRKRNASGYEEEVEARKKRVISPTISSALKQKSHRGTATKVIRNGNTFSDSNDYYSSSSSSASAVSSPKISQDELQPSTSLTWNFSEFQQSLKNRRKNQAKEIPKNYGQIPEFVLNDVTDFEDELSLRRDEARRRSSKIFVDDEDDIHRHGPNQKEEEKDASTSSSENTRKKLFLLKQRRGTQLALSNNSSSEEEKASKNSSINQNKNKTVIASKNAHQKEIPQRRSLTERRGTQIEMSSSTGDDEGEYENEKNKHQKLPCSPQPNDARRGTKIKASSTTSSSSPQTASSTTTTSSNNTRFNQNKFEPLLRDDFANYHYYGGNNNNDSKKHNEKIQMPQEENKNQKENLLASHCVASVSIFSAANIGSCVAPTCISTILPKIIDSSTVECSRVHRFDLSMATICPVSSRTILQNDDDEGQEISQETPPIADGSELVASWKQQCVEPFHLTYSMAEEQRQNAVKIHQEKMAKARSGTAPNVSMIVTSAGQTVSLSPASASDMTSTTTTKRNNVIHHHSNNPNSHSSTSTVPSAPEKTPRGMHIVWILASCRLAASSPCCIHTRQKCVKSLVKTHHHQQRRRLQNQESNHESSRDKIFVSDQHNGLFPDVTTDKEIMASVVMSSADPHRFQHQRNLSVDGLPSSFCLSCFLMKIVSEAATKDSDVTFIFDLGGAIHNNNNDGGDEIKNKKNPLLVDMWKQSVFSFTNIAGIVLATGKSKNKPFLGSVTSSLLLDHYNAPPIRRSPLQTLQELFLASNNRQKQQQIVLRDTNVALLVLKNKRETAKNRDNQQQQQHHPVLFTQFCDQKRSPQNAFFAALFQTIGRPSRALVLPHTLIGSALKFVEVADAMNTFATSEAKIVGVAVLLQPDVSFEQITLRHAQSIQRALLQQQFNKNQNDEWIARICAGLDGRVFVFLMVDAVKIQQEARHNRNDERKNKVTSQNHLIPRPPSAANNSNNNNSESTETSRRQHHQQQIAEESVTELQTRLTLTAGHILKKRHQENRFNAIAGFSIADVKVVLQEQRKKEMLNTFQDEHVAVVAADHELDEEETMEVLVGEILLGSCLTLKKNSDDGIKFVDFLPG